MPIEIISKTVGTGWFKAASEDDMLKAQAYKPDTLVKMTITGARKVRSYKELCCYKGSCKYIANMNFNENMDTPEKVDLLTKIRCGFTDGVIQDSRLNQTHFLVKSLAYKNCDHPESHKFIADALEKHSELVGISTEDYVRLLNEQK